MTAGAGEPAGSQQSSSSNRLHWACVCILGMYLAVHWFNACLLCTYFWFCHPVPKQLHKNGGQDAPRLRVHTWYKDFLRCSKWSSPFKIQTLSSCACTCLIFVFITLVNNQPLTLPTTHARLEETSIQQWVNKVWSPAGMEFRHILFLHLGSPLGETQAAKARNILFVFYIKDRLHWRRTLETRWTTSDKFQVQRYLCRAQIIIYIKITLYIHTHIYIYKNNLLPQCFWHNCLI